MGGMGNEAIKPLLLPLGESHECRNSACLGSLEPFDPSLSRLFLIPEIEESCHLLLHRMAEGKIGMVIKDSFQSRGILI